MFGTLLWWFIIGLVAGAIARLFVRGKHRLGIVGTAVLGVAGSFVGGFGGYVLFNHDLGEGALQTSGIFGSVIGAMILLWIWGRLDRERGRRARRARGR